MCRTRNRSSVRQRNRSVINHQFMVDGRSAIEGGMACKCWTMKAPLKPIDVIVIGNGPSAICLSYLLSGNTPHYNGNSVPNEYLQYKLNQMKSTSILDQDLEYLSEGLEGRSNNPVALLFDTLNHPNADFGIGDPSAITWKYDCSRKIEHMVLGKGPSGGVWQTLEGGIQTVSLGTWMELPGMPFSDWNNQFRQSNNFADGIAMAPDRPVTDEVAEYYAHYIKSKDLSSNFYNFHTVTSVRKVLDFTHRHVDRESGETFDPKCDSDFVWEVCGQKIVTKDNKADITEFCYHAENVVLATGSSDAPNRLDIEGESLPFVLHSVKQLEQAIFDGYITTEAEPIIIIGAGLSAADAILYALEAKCDVIHIFRRDSDDPMLAFNTLPKNMYPEYHRVHRMMQGLEILDGYTPYAACKVKEIFPGGHVLVTISSGCDVMLNASRVLVIIGARPNLSFLPSDGMNLGIIPDTVINSKNNPINVYAFTYECFADPYLYAMGPLVSDNFVRFLQGGALAITNHLWMKEKWKLC